MHQNLHILIAVTSWCTNIPVPIYAPCIHQIITHLYCSTGHHQLSFCDPNKVSPFFPKNLPSDNPFWLASSAPVTISLCFICVTRQPRHPVMPKPGNEFSGIHYSGLVFRKKNTCSVNFFSILLPASISYEDLPVHNVSYVVVLKHFYEHAEWCCVLHATISVCWEADVFQNHREALPTTRHCNQTWFSGHLLVADGKCPHKRRNQIMYFQPTVHFHSSSQWSRVRWFSVATDLPC